MPRKTRSVDGPVVLSCAIGTSKNSQRAMHMYIFLRQVASLLSTERKSSRIFTRDVMPNLFFKIHSNPEEDLSKILHDEEQPIGRHLSKYYLPFRSKPVTWHCDLWRGMSLNASLMSVLAMNALGECCCTSLIASGIRHRGSPPAIYTVSLSVSDSVCLSLVLGHLKTGCLLLHMWHVRVLVWAG